MRVFYFLPEWACFLLTTLFILISHEIGYGIGSLRRLRPGENPETAAGTISGIMVGLLAFMLAFTFNGASNNHDVRKDLVVEEANVVRTAYERSMLLPEPQKAQVKNLLGEYLDIRLKVRTMQRSELKAALMRTVGIQRELWDAVVAVQRSAPTTPMLNLFTESVDKIFDTHVKRFNAIFQGRISPVIWYVLYLLTFITMAMMGYRIGLHGIRSKFMEVTLILAFSSVLLVITALDRPNGMMKIDQKPIAGVFDQITAGK